MKKPKLKKKYTVTLGPNTRVQLWGHTPGLLWAEIVTLMSEWTDFQNKKKGTRFDQWL